MYWRLCSHLACIGRLFTDVRHGVQGAGDLKETSLANGSHHNHRDYIKCKKYLVSFSFGLSKSASTAICLVDIGRDMKDPLDVHGRVWAFIVIFINIDCEDDDDDDNVTFQFLMMTTMLPSSS